MCCFLVKKKHTMVLMSVLVHQKGLEGSWGLQQSQRTDFAPWNTDWCEGSQLLRFETRAWPASQQLQVLCFFKSPLVSRTFCSPAGRALGAAVWSWGRLQPAALPNALTDTRCSWPLRDLLHVCLLPAWTYWPGHCLFSGILKPLLNWLFAFGGRDNSCLWLRSVMTSYFN